MEDVPFLDWYEVESPGDAEYHDVATITVAELVSDGILTRERWDACDWYDDAQRDRLWNKFLGRYAWREIGILPIRKWLERLSATINEKMPKYKPIYEAMSEGSTQLRQGSEWHKARDVFSSFPQSRLGSSNQDYASSGNDREYETIRDGGLMDALRDNAYDDVDVLLLDDLAPLFFGLVSVNVNY